MNAYQFTQREQQMKAFSSATRLQILSYLQSHPSATVGELAEVLQLTDGAVSQHLRFLKHAGVVVPTRRGMYTSYRLPLKKNPVLKAVLRELS